MKKLFIHHPLFRLFSPVFSGSVVYLLILLINNNVEQLEEQFLGEELYVCIGLSLIIQEFSRLLLIGFRKVLKNVPLIIGLITQVISSMSLCILLVSVLITVYYESVLGFSPIAEELWMFNGIFCSITLIYILLHISHQYLYKVNATKLYNELCLKQMTEDEFVRFKVGINPDLLFDGFEALINLIQKNDDVDEFIDHIASIYRYTLSRKERQLVSIEEELETLDHLLSLMNCLPYRKVTIKSSLKSDFLFIPTSLLKMTEYIVRKSIRSSERPIEISLSENEESIILKYKHNDTIDKAFDIYELEDFHQVYKIYTPIGVKVEEDIQNRLIYLPKLKTDPKAVL